MIDNKDNPTSQPTSEETQSPIHAGTESAAPEPTLLEAAEQKAAAHWELLMRTKAELDNMRRRMERELESAHKYGVERLLQALLPVLDSLDQAVQTCEPQSPHRDGMEMTLKLFMDTVQKFGVIRMVPEVGEAFDPTNHEAIAMQPDPGTPNCIVQTIQAGYRLYDRTMRPARVIVSQAVPNA